MITVNKDGIIELWQKTFGDSREYVESFFEIFSDKAKFLTKEFNGKVASMLCMIDCDLAIDSEMHKCKYIYACATAEEYKRKGLITELLDEARDEAEKDGYDFLVLVPANEALFDFYEKRGYSKFFKVKKIEISSKIMKILSRGERVNQDFSAKELNGIRKAYLTKKPYVQWKDEQIEFIKTTYKTSGKILFSENTGYAFVRQENEIAYIDEICASGESFCEMLKVICDNCDAGKYCFYVPMDCPFTSDSFEIEDKGMILPLRNKINPDGYIGLVME